MQLHDAAGERPDASIRIPNLEDGKQYKFSGVLESLRQEERLALGCASKEYLRRMSVIWKSPLSDYNRVLASNQSALPVLGYLMWTQHWPLTEIKKVDRDARKLWSRMVGNQCGSTALLYLPQCKGGRALRSVEVEYKATKVKAAVKLYENQDAVMEMVREFEERAMDLGPGSLVKETAKYSEDFGLQLQLKHPNPRHRRKDDQYSVKVTFGG